MKFGIVGNVQKENFSAAISGLIEKIDAVNAEYIIDSDIIEGMRGSPDLISIRKDAVVERSAVFNNSDIVIALGGDGTILRYARWAALQNKPILGVNLGKLGFLSEVSIDELSECIDEILRGDYVVSNRLTIDCTICGNQDEAIFGINDVVVDRGGMLRVIDVETYVDEDYLITFKGDGLIVSTPTGSTAYSLSCGGPIVAPDTDVLIITPISPHTLNARPIIVPADKEIRVVIASPEPFVQLSVDGQLQRRLPIPTEMKLKRSDKVVKLIKRKVRSYYDVLRSKLMWGRDIRINTERN
jgi:NAD+ kinase